MGLFLFFVSGARFIIVVVVSSSTMFYFPSPTIKTGITSVWRSTIIYHTRVCLVIFCIGNNIYFILHHDGWNVGRRSIRRLCIIFRNCPDMEDSVNLPIIALTNLLFSGVKIALFNALKSSTGSCKRIIKSFNLVTCRPRLTRKSSVDVSGCLRYSSKA